MAKVKLFGCKCERCKHIWVARTKKGKPLVCPKCKSHYWDKPQKKTKMK
ncbi:MAG: hypothetical protein ABH986_03455 [archaeon]